jgi:hypothetical protein
MSVNKIIESLELAKEFYQREEVIKLLEDKSLSPPEKTSEILLLATETPRDELLKGMNWVANLDLIHMVAELYCEENEIEDDDEDTDEDF